MIDQPHVLVVGATSGIGRAAAQHLSANGWRVTATGRRAGRLAEIQSPTIATVVHDVAELETIPDLVKRVVADGGALKAIVYCAGRQLIKPIRTTSPGEIDDIYRTNLVAPTVFAAQFAGRKVSVDGAVFCVISSIAGLRAEPGIVAYSASKAGLTGLIQGMARELGPKRAVAIAPGWLDTEMTQAVPSVYNSGFRERLEKNSPAGVASVDDVVRAMDFLLSASAAHLTGFVLPVDGGAVLQG